MTCVDPKLSLFWTALELSIDYEFMTRQEFERNFDSVTLLFSIAPYLGVQLENSGVMLPKFLSDSCLVINS